jgi:hypothetical protein
MLAAGSRWLLWLGAAAFLVLGLAAFIAPGWASANFPWSVGPFLAVTIGAWSLGTAAIAADAARSQRLERSYPLLVFLSFFGAGQLAVALAFASRLRLGVPLTYPYLIGLIAVLAAGLLVLAGEFQDGRGLRGSVGIRGGPRQVPTWARASTLLFVVLVGGLSIATLIAGSNGAAARGEFFPEPLGLFSIRAFSAFFFALTMSALSLLPARSLVPYHELARAGLYLIVPITVAALLNIGLFDFVGRPGSLVYLAAYVLVGIALAVRLWYSRPHAGDTSTVSPAP